jgi:hypothetical protein
MVDDDICALRKRRDVSSVGAFRAWSGEAFTMKLLINNVSADRSFMARRPKLAKTLIVFMAAFRTWPVTSGKRSRLVEKEQFGVRVRPHDDTMTSTEFCQARKPASHLRVPHNTPSLVVQDSAIAHDEAAPPERHDVAKRCYPIL